MPSVNGDSVVKLIDRAKLILFDWNGTLSPSLGEVVPGLAELAESLQSQKKILGIISTVGADSIQPRLAAVQLEGMFSIVHGHAFDKAEALDEAATQAGVMPGEALYIGDTVEDIHAAHEANMPAVAVLSGFDGRDELARAAPEAIIQSVHDLLPKEAGTSVD